MYKETVTVTIAGVLESEQIAQPIPVHVEVTAVVTYDRRDDVADAGCDIQAWKPVEDLPEGLWDAAYEACGGDDAAEHAAKVAFWEIYREQQGQRAGGWV